MREVLISIQPRWVEKIVSGEKTVEVRKTRPKCETPFKCYIYETKDKRFEDMGYCWSKGEYFEHHIGKVIGEFVCDRITEYECSSFGFGELATTCGTCLTYDEILNYCNGNDLYGWHITDLVVYDEPRELGEFSQVKVIRGYHKKDEPKTDGLNIPRLLNSTRIEVSFLTRPPQSWCYIEPRQTAD